MKYLLDTDVFSTAGRDSSPLLRQRLVDTPTSELGISVITVGEVEFGLSRKRHPKAALDRIDQFRAGLRILPIDEAVARRYGQIRSGLERQGTHIGPDDLWIAAIALVNDLTLVTGNEREFARVPTLRVENWMR